MTDHTYRRPRFFPERVDPKRAERMKTVGMARLFEKYGGPQAEMVAPQPVVCEPKMEKRSFWSPKQVGEMGDSELRATASRLERTDNIISSIGIAAIFTDAIAWTGRIAYEAVVNGLEALRGKGFDMFDKAALAGAGTAVLLLAFSRIILADEKGSCYKELLRRADAEKEGK